MCLACPLGSLDLQLVPINHLRLLLFGLRFEDPPGVPDQTKAPLTNRSDVLTESSRDSAVEFLAFHFQLAFRFLVTNKRVLPLRRGSSEESLDLPRLVTGLRFWSGSEPMLVEPIAFSV